MIITKVRSVSFMTKIPDSARVNLISETETAVLLFSIFTEERN